MNCDITLKNYRCFADEAPVTLHVRRGFTALIGPNNSGKSALLRFFYECRSVFQMLGTLGNGEILTALNGTPRGFPLFNVSDALGVFHNATERPLVIEIAFHSESGDSFEGEERPQRLKLTAQRTGTFLADLTTNQGPFGQAPNIQWTPSHLESQGRRVDMRPPCELMASLSRTLLVGPFRNAINIGGSDAYFDIQVGEPFVRQWRTLKSGTSVKASRATIKLTKEIRQIFGFTGLEVNPSDDDRTLQVILDDQPYRLNEVGAGIAQFILVMVNAAVLEPAWILIDEPELNLHPSLQLSFLTSLGGYASHGVIYSTHTVGLARSMAQRIYAFRRTASNTRSEVSAFEGVPNLTEFLGELSYSSYQALGFDRLLLVEGSHDVTTMQQFLRKVGKDKAVLLLPLGGSSMIRAGVSPNVENRPGANV